jgi:hypothetical protein
VTDAPWPDEIEGWFWVPSRQPRKVRGVLMASWDGAELRLEEPIDDGGRRYDRLYGEDMALRPMVLTDIFTVRRHFARNDPTRFWQIMRVNGALFGSQRPRTRFRAAHVRLEGLHEFIAEPAITVETKPLRAVWSAAPSKTSRADGVTIRLRQDPMLKGTPSSIDFSADVSAEISTRRGREVFAWHQTVEALSTFVGLCISRPAPMAKLELVDSRGRRVENRFAVRPHRASGHQRVWLTAPLFGDHLATALERWYRYRRDSFESFSIVVEYVSFAGQLNWADRLLLLARFVEVHDRRTRPGGQIPKADHRHRVAAVLAAAPSEHRAWLRQSLQFSNNLTLRSRLNGAIADLGPEVLPLFGEATIDAFAKTVTDTRNYYTHYSSGLADKAARGFALTLLTKRLWLVVRGLLLLEMGLSRALIAEALRLDYEWDWLCAQPHP